MSFVYFLFVAFVSAMYLFKEALEIDMAFVILSFIEESNFEVLKYIPIFPGGVNKLADQDGNVLPDCFLMPPKTTALDFAYRLHSDFGDKFIRVIDVKTKMTIGKEHLLKPGDVVEIISDK